MAEPRLVKPARSASEDELLAFVRDAAGWGGWLVYHTHRSDRSEAGFPDIVAVHRTLDRLVFAELKSARGKVRPDQQVWLDALECAARFPPDDHPVYDRPMPEVYLWRPADADEIVAVFLGHRRWRYRPAPEPEAVASRRTPTSDGSRCRAD